MNFKQLFLVILTTISGCNFQANKHQEKLQMLQKTKDSIYMKSKELKNIYEYINLQSDAITAHKIDSFMKVNHNLTNFNLEATLNLTKRYFYEKKDSLAKLCRVSDSSVIEINREIENLRLEMSK